MTTESVMREAAERAFVAAFLLSGDADRAEAAVLESIGSMQANSADELVEGTVKAAIGRDGVTSQGFTEPAFLALPLELQRVLQLPDRLRQCFVLRVLVRLTSEACADLLGVDSHQVDQAACDAMAELSAIRAGS